MHRPTIGLIAILLLAAGIALRWSSDETVSSACLRVGAVMTILWLAEPQMRDVPRWAAIAGVGGLFIAMRWPKFLVLALPIAVVLWILRPRDRAIDESASHRRL
jgi:hypothetical protein